MDSDDHRVERADPTQSISDYSHDVSLTVAKIDEESSSLYSPTERDSEHKAYDAGVCVEYCKTRIETPLGKLRKSLPFACCRVAAPMVGASDLPFRMLTRRYGVDTAYTQMLLAKSIVADDSYTTTMLKSCVGDTPLVVQIAGDDPATMLEAALRVEPHCSALDINLGCPQEHAQTEHYGAYMTFKKDWPLVHEIVSTIAERVRIPVFCKIRLQQSVQDTVDFARLLESAGCKLLAIHGRKCNGTRKRRIGPADMAAIAAVNAAVGIPVLANGNVRFPEDISNNLMLSGAHGIMAGEGLLRNPAIFAHTTQHELTALSRIALGMEYLDLVAQLMCSDGVHLDETITLSLGGIANHLGWMLGKEGHGKGVRYDPRFPIRPLELKRRLNDCENIPQFRRVLQDIRESMDMPSKELSACHGIETALAEPEDTGT